MIRPAALKEGDRVGLISPARKISREELEPAQEILESWGLVPELAPNLFAAQDQFAGSDAQRLADCQQMLDDPGIKAILCARGGYGSVRIVDRLDFSRFLRKPKWFCGYSDVCVIHHRLARLGVESLHSSMPVNFATNSAEALESLRLCLFGGSPQYRFPAHAFNRKGQVSGILTGGNLSIIYSQLGSPTRLRTSGRILFIEDLDEYLYHIDRMMYNLKRNGYFEHLAGLVAGGLTDMNDNAVPFGESAHEIVQRHFKEYKFPLCFNFPAGHLADNRCLILGRMMSLEITESETRVRYHE